MGQYYNIANEDKQEYIVPSLLKMWEIMNNPIAGSLFYLTADAPHDGGGTPTANYGRFRDKEGNVDWEAFHEANNVVWPNFGRWSGDRIRTVGDYAESGLYDDLKGPEWTDISDEVLPEIRAAKEDTMGRCGIRIGSFGSLRDKVPYAVFVSDQDPLKFYGAIFPDDEEKRKETLHKDTPEKARQAANALRKNPVTAA
jgi:hypothetical protein